MNAVADGSGGGGSVGGTFRPRSGTSVQFTDVTEILPAYARYGPASSPIPTDIRAVSPPPSPPPP